MIASKRRLFVGVFTLALALVVGVSVFVSRAAGARLFTFGPSTAACASNGQTVPAGYQDSNFGLELQGFWDSELVYISFTFPDGRVFSPIPAQLVDANSLEPYYGLNGLDGVIDMPENFPWVFPVTDGGDYYYTFRVTNKWPYGCYTFNARGAASNRQASGSFVVAPRSGPAPNAGPTTLSIQDNTTGDPSGLHGALVNIFGRGFRGAETVSVWITGPDGVVYNYPQQLASDIGSFESTFQFTEVYPVGRYAFTALGTQSGYQVIAYFNLGSRPSTPVGWAQLRVAFPYPATGDQRTRFEVQGKRFDPHERVDIWTTLPDNSVRGLPSQYANEWGEFYAELYLDERLPTGAYDFTAKGANSGRLTITTFNLDAGPQNVTAYPPDPDPAPEVVESSSPAAPGSVGPSESQPGLPVLDPQPEF